MWLRNGICLVMCASISTVIHCSNVDENLEENLSKPLETLMQSTLLKMLLILRQNKNETSATEFRNVRVKRQGSGAGKYADAAKIDNLKAFRIYLTLFKNLWTNHHVGGSHPLHPDVPKPVVQLFMQRIMEFFFPPIGADPHKA